MRWSNSPAATRSERPRHPAGRTTRDRRPGRHVALTSVIVVGLGVLVGMTLGLFGGGGSILTVPILVYIAGQEPHQAVAASLFVVGMTSAAGVSAHARAGRVRWRIGAVFGATGMLGAFIGGYAGGYVDETVLMIIFAIMMVATALAMLQGRRTDTGMAASVEPDPAWGRTMLHGFLVGGVTGMIGAGGGFLIVPALALLSGLSMVEAVGTSLLVIVLNSLTGLTGHLMSVQPDWPLTIAFTATAIAGSFAGVRLAGRFPENVMRTGFACFVLVMGAVVLIQEAPGLISSMTGA